MKLTRVEMGTILRTSDGDDFWAISTASHKFIRMFTKPGYQADYTVLNPGEYRSFRVPLKLVSFRKPRKKLSRTEIAARIRNRRKVRRFDALPGR